MGITDLFSQSSRIFIVNEGLGITKSKKVVTHTSHMNEYITGYASNLQHNILKISYSCKILNLLRLLITINSVVTLPPMLLLEKVDLSMEEKSHQK